MKVIGVILGILIAIGGCCIAFAPGLGLEFICIIAAIAMIVEGISSIIKWNAARKLKQSEALLLFGGIVSILLGIVLLGGYFARLAFMTVLIFVIALWLVILGITRIVIAFKSRKIVDENKPSWGWILVAGILATLCGVLCFIAPYALAAIISILVGISIIMAGLGVVTLSLADPR